MSKLIKTLKAKSSRLLIFKNNKKILMLPTNAPKIKRSNFVERLSKILTPINNNRSKKKLSKNTKSIYIVIKSPKAIIKEENYKRCRYFLEKIFNNYKL